MVNHLRWLPAAGALLIRRVAAIASPTQGPAVPCVGLATLAALLALYIQVLVLPLFRCFFMKAESSILTGGGSSGGSGGRRAKTPIYCEPRKYSPPLVAMRPGREQVGGQGQRPGDTRREGRASVCTEGSGSTHPCGFCHN
jgi:hypothetical protein